MNNHMCVLFGVIVCSSWHRVHDNKRDPSQSIILPIVPGSLHDYTMRVHLFLHRSFSALGLESNIPLFCRARQAVMNETHNAMTVRQFPI